MNLDLTGFILEIIYLIKNGAYVINFDKYSDIGTHWIALELKILLIGIEHIPKEIKKFIVNKNIKTNIFRIEAYDSIMYGYFCIGFIDFMLKGKSFFFHQVILNEMIIYF